MPRQVTPSTMRTQITLQTPTTTENTRGELGPSCADPVPVYAEAAPVRSRATCAVACIRSMLEAWAGATPMVFKRC